MIIFHTQSLAEAGYHPDQFIPLGPAAFYTSEPSEQLDDDMDFGVQFKLNDDYKINGQQAAIIRAIRELSSFMEATHGFGLKTKFYERGHGSYNDGELSYYRQVYAVELSIDLYIMARN